MKVKSPTVSIIIPSYNREHLIGRSVQSVLSQTYKDFEVMIIDDGSTDNTVQVIEEFLEQDERVKYIRLESNKGAAAARNVGIKAARGKYIAFQDSDDEWDPRKLEWQVKIFTQVPEQVGVIYTDMWRVAGKKRKYIPAPDIKPEDGKVYKDALERVMGVGIGTAIIKRECFNIAGMFDERLPRFIDLELFIRLSKHYWFYHIKEALINYHDSGKHISGNDAALIEANALIVRKYAHDAEVNRKSLAKFQYKMANILCQSEHINPWKSFLVKALKSDPLNVKYLLALLLSLFGKYSYNKLLKVWLEFQDVNLKV